MANWGERGRQAKEQEEAARRAREQQAQQASSAQERINVEKIKEKLALFEKLRIAGILEEIRRDLWKGLGKVGKSLDVNSKQGTSSADLRYDQRYPEPSYQTLTERAHGPHPETRSTGGTSGGYDVTSTVNGPYDKHVGDKLTGISDYKTPTSYHLGARLAYGLASDSYALTVAGGYMSFRGPEIDMGTLRGFVDKSFLDYAKNPTVPGYEEAMKQQRRRQNIESQIGTVYRPGQNKPDFY